MEIPFKRKTLIDFLVPLPLPRNIKVRILIVQAIIFSTFIYWLTR